MKFNEKHKNLLTLVSGSELKDDVEINGAVYRLSSLRNEDHGWIAQGIENTDGTLSLIKKRKDRMVASSIVGIGHVGSDIVMKQDLFEIPDSEYGRMLKNSDKMMNEFLSDQMLELIQMMDEKVVTLLYQKVVKLNEKVEEAIVDSTPFLKAQGD